MTGAIPHLLNASSRFIAAKNIKTSHLQMRKLVIKKGNGKPTTVSFLLPFSYNKCQITGWYIRRWQK